MEPTTLAFIFLGIAILLLPAALRNGQNSNEMQDIERRAIRQLIADGVESERNMQRGSFSEVLIGMFIGALLAVALIAFHVIPTAALMR